MKDITISITTFGFEVKENGKFLEYVAFSESNNPFYEIEVAVE